MSLPNSKLPKMASAYDDDAGTAARYKDAFIAIATSSLNTTISHVVSSERDPN